MVNLVLACLKNHYSERPNFLQLEHIIRAMKRDRHLEFEDYKHRLARHIKSTLKIHAEPEVYTPQISRTNSHFYFSTKRQAEPSQEYIDIEPVQKRLDKMSAPAEPAPPVESPMPAPPVESPQALLSHLQVNVAQ